MTTHELVSVTKHSTPARLLVIDDEPAMQKVLRRILISAGYEVHVASDGEEALEQMSLEAFDLVMTDVKMPRMDGMSVLRHIRSVDADLPVIIFTAAPTAENAIEALTQRATGYICKPFEPSKVLEEVERALMLQEFASLRKEARDLVRKRHEESVRNSELGGDFDRALNGLFMVYQPIVCWSSRSVFGYEALVRSAEPALPHPGALFDAAERLGRLSELGSAIRAICTAPFAGAPPRLSLFVNLHSADLLEPSLYDRNSALGRMANRVVLEITERAHLNMVPETELQISKLRRLGYRIAIDDIGAGYSGLNSFAALRPDLVKLDMALVRNLHQDPVRQRLVRMLINLSNDLGISVVGEGVETVSERDALIEMGCDLLQGYLFARPAAELAEVSLERGCD